MRKAVVVADIVHEFIYGERFGSPRMKAIVPRVVSLLDRARRSGAPVVYVHDAHRRTDPEMGIWGDHAMRGSEAAEIIPEIAPHPGEAVIEKRTYSCFQRTSLDRQLKAQGAREIVLVGVLTDICIRHTAADAFYRGYAITVPSDCVETTSDEVQHRALAEMEALYAARVLKGSEVMF
jgi:nicotinamidase-related amidase